MLRAASRLYQHRADRQVTAPASEPVDADALRAYIDATESMVSDAVAEGYITLARQWIEDHTGLAMITQTRRTSLDRWPTGQEPWWDGVRDGAISMLAGPNRVYEIPRYPLISITGVTVYNEASVATSVTVANVFDVDSYSIPGRLALKQGQTWPVALRGTNAIEITYTCGYGAASDVPAPVRQAVTQMAAHIYEHRGSCDLSEAFTASGAAGMIGPYTVARI